MEKSTPHCKLTVVKTYIQAGKVRVTRAARLGATELGFELSDMLAVVMALKTVDFYKSMSCEYEMPCVWRGATDP